MPTFSDTKLFVGGLAWATDEEGLRTAFEEFGPVRLATVITDRETGRSRGFGFVEYENAEDAARAQSEMNETTLDGRKVRVAFAEVKPKTGGGGNRDRGGASGFRRDRSEYDEGGGHPPV